MAAKSTVSPEQLKQLVKDYYRLKSLKEKYSNPWEILKKKYGYGTNKGLWGALKRGGVTFNK